MSRAVWRPNRKRIPLWRRSRADRGASSQCLSPFVICESLRWVELVVSTDKSRFRHAPSPTVGVNLFDLLCVMRIVEEQL